MIIRNGVLVTENNKFISDIRTENGLITEVRRNIINDSGEEEFDARDCFIIPGGVDAHTHFDMPCNDIKTSDDFYTGSRAALAGGTTTIIDFAESDDPHDLEQGLRAWHEKAGGRSYCDYGFHMTVSAFSEEIESQIERIIKGGVTSFKAYTAYRDSMGLEDRDILRLMECMRKNDALLCIHCESDDMMKHFEAKGNFDPTDMRNHPRSRNNIVEKEAISRMIDMADFTGSPIYIVHVSTGEGIIEIENARQKGQRVYSETCPHYLLLDESRYELENFESAKYIMSPPLRAKKDMARLWEAIRSGAVDTVSTDHCSFDFETQKHMGINDYRLVPNGIPGAEHRIELMLHNFAEQGLELTDAVRLCCTNPAKIFGIYPQKGSLAPGSDADIVIIKKKEISHISHADQIQEVDYTPFEGMDISFKVMHVIKSGEWAVKDGSVISLEPKGRFLKRNKSCLLIK